VSSSTISGGTGTGPLNAETLGITFVKASS
jgi:hypothetical protein